MKHRLTFPACYNRRMRRAWLLPLSSAFCLVSFALLVGVLAGPGCQTRCFNAFDCGPGSFCAPDGRCETECFTDLDCREPIECADNPAGCRPKGLTCNGQGKCTGNYVFADAEDVRDIDLQEVPDEIDGWDDPPGSGAAFIVDSIAIAQQDRGFDLDSSCDEDGCIDNALWQLGDLGNDQIRQGLLGGESLLLIELAGLDQPFVGRDPSLSVKMYAARDADSPFFPANNFRVPDGQSTCCEFTINPRSLTGIPRVARARAPAEIQRGRLRSLLPVPIEFTLTVGEPPHPEIRLEQIKLSGRVSADLRRLSDGLIGGAVPTEMLARTDNPYCKSISPRCPVDFPESTLIDLVSALLGPEPDIDLDGDGLECIIDTDGDGTVDVCCDGDPSIPSSCPQNRTCPTAQVGPIVEGRPPWTCALDPRMADGYSVGFTYTAVQASILSVGQ